ncbi:MAG TPA: HDIG domain-containing protein [Dehalococcoidia bacterium]|nr:HDIG domain-containing protein [Dehalococcoidia bacterium]
MPSFLRDHTFLLPITVAGFAVALFVALVPVSTSSIGLKEGEIAIRTIRAPHDISFTSPTLTQRRQDEAAEAVPDSLQFDASVAGTKQTQLNEQLGRIRTIINDASSTPASRGASLERVEKLQLSPGSATLLRNLTPVDFEAVATEARRALATTYDQTLPPDLVAQTREKAVNYVDKDLPRETAMLVADLFRPFIDTNQAVDKGRTDALRAAARAGVAPVQVAFAKNQEIVARDEPVTPEAHEALVEAGLVGKTWKPDRLGASALLAIVAAFAARAGLGAFRPTVSPRELLVVGLALAIPVFIMKVYLPQVLPDDQRHFLAYLIPVAAASMVLAGFVGAAVALLVAALIALCVCFGALLLLDVTVIGIVGTLDVARLALVCGLPAASGVFAVRNAERLSQFLVGGLLVGVSIFAVLIATWLIDPDRTMNDVPWILLVASINGALSGFLAAGVFVTLGSLFGVTTRLQLLEMSQLSNPLLLRLQDEAPSTFQHSVIVASLAEKGAHVIGADALLARVGCYYHDIGKLARPGFFIENQLGGANPHDALAPTDSARIIADHTTDGLALARQYKLPEKVAAFIPEHHGTRLVSYFYRRAMEEDPDLDATPFRYKGPKPQSRETAIAMLADSCEATVRAEPDHSPERIGELVEEVFAERLAEGQLDESDLTLRDIRALAESFKATLSAVYHPRVEYPAPTDAEMLLRRLPVRKVSNQ